MGEEHKHTEGQGGGCCQTKSTNCCCSSQKLIALLVALLIFFGGFWVGKMSVYGQGMKVCPLTGAPMQTQK